MGGQDSMLKSRARYSVYRRGGEKVVVMANNQLGRYLLGT